MTADRTAPTSSAFGHVLKRLFLALFGYLVAVVMGLIAIVAIYGLLSVLPGMPEHFKSMSMTPIAMLFVPPLWVFYLMVAVATTFIPAFIAVIAGEFFRLRTVWLNMVFGAAVALFGYLLLAPQAQGVAAAPAYADIGVVAVAGLVGGFVYWLIAGRDAGFGPESRLD